MNLDYTLTTTAERLHFLQTHISSLSQLEVAANYLLYYDKTYTPKPKISDTSLPLNEETLQTEKLAKYTSPKQTINWAHPILKVYQENIHTLKLAEQLATNPETKYKLRQWKIQHNLDAGLVQKCITTPMPSQPTWTTQQPIDIDTQIDYTNSFHIKYVIAFYSALRESEQSKFDMDYFDMLVESAPLTAWQKHLLIRRIDNASHITIAREIVEQYGKILSPSYISQTMRTIYKQVAQQAEQEELKWYYRGAPEMWRKCRKCGEKKLDNLFHFHKGATICKLCARKNKQQNGGEEENELL